MINRLKNLRLNTKSLLIIITNNLLLFILFSIIIGLIVFTNIINEDYDEKFQIINSTVKNKFTEIEDNYKLITKLITSDDFFIDALKENNRMKLISLIEDKYKILKDNLVITHFNIINKYRKILVRFHNIHKKDDLITRKTLLEALKTKSSKSNIEIGKTGFYVFRFVYPVISNDNILGFIELGIELDKILDDKIINFDTALFIDKNKISGNTKLLTNNYIRDNKILLYGDSKIFSKSLLDKLDLSLTNLTKDNYKVLGSFYDTYEDKYNYMKIPFIDINNSLAGFYLLRISIENKVSVFKKVYLSVILVILIISLLFIVIQIFVK